MHRIAKTAIILFLALLAAFLPSCGASGPGQDVQVLPALKQAGLAGKMVFIVYNQAGNQLVQLDLASGQVRTLFSAPDRSWLASAEAAPSGDKILLAYAPPPPKGQVQLANTDLYQMPVDGSSAPQPLMQRSAANESFTNPAWAPDGQSIYYTHTVPSNSDPSGAESRIERAKPGGKADVLLANSIWPRLSPDGAKLSYLALAKFVSDNTLSLANTDGSGALPLLQAQQFPIVDAHIFSPDGKTIYFSAPDQGLLQSSASQDEPGEDILTFGIPFFGVQPVSAHNNPSDWFQVSVGGGKAKLIARVKDVNMIPTFSSDGQWLAYISLKGLFVMRPDGSQLTQLAGLVGMGSLNWIK